MLQRDLCYIEIGSYDCRIYTFINFCNFISYD
jgi:hypothetical protein